MSIEPVASWDRMCVQMLDYDQIDQSDIARAEGEGMIDRDLDLTVDEGE